MKKRLKRILRVGGFLLVGFVLLPTAAVLIFRLDKPLVKTFLQGYVSKKTGIALEVGALDYTLFPLHVVITSAKATYKTPILTMEAVLDRVEAWGSLRKLLNGVKPAFEIAEVNIREIQVNQTKISETPGDFQGLILQIADLLDYAEKSSLKCGRVTVSLPGRNFRLEDVVLGCARTPAAGTFALLLDAKRIGAAADGGRLSFESRLHVDGTLALAKTTGFDIRVALAAPHLDAAGRAESFEALSLEAKGSWETGSSRFEFSKLTLMIPGLIDVSGAGTADLGPSVSCNVSARARLDSLEAVAAIGAPYLPPNLRGARIQGKARMEGTFSLAPGSPAASAKIDGSAEFDGVTLESIAAGFPLRAELSGVLKFSGSPSDIRAVADIRSSFGRISRGGLEIGKSTVRLHVSASTKAVEISGFEGGLEHLAFALPGNRKLAFAEVKLSGSARVDLARRSVALTSLEARLPALSPVRLSGRFDMDPRGVRQARLETGGQKIPALRALLGPFLPPGLAGWEFDGAVDIAVEAGTTAGPKRDWEYSCVLAMSQVKLNDPTFAIAGEGLEPRVRVKGTYDPAKGLWAWTGALELAQGEFLWNNFYISWEKQPLKADVSGVLEQAAMMVDGLTVRVAFPPLGELHADGALRLAAPASFRLKAGARLNLEPLYSLYSRAGAAPESRLRLGGTLSGDFEIQRDAAALSVKGRVALGEGFIENPAAKVSITGFEADVPVDFAIPAGPGAQDSAGGAASPEKGFFRFRELKTPILTFSALTLVLQSLPNAYRIEPFGLDLFGSRLEFGETGLTLEPQASTFHGRTSLKLTGLDLTKLPVPSAELPLMGKAQADFPEVDIAPSRITAAGRAEIDIFGGRLIIRDVAVASPFSVGRAVSCNVDILELDLKKMTDVIPFGEMTGIIRGEIRGLTISYGQLESFNLRLESVPKKGVSQTFSLKAVDNLTVLSSGRQTTGGSGQFWLRFIKGFRYKEMGIVSTLKNDTFTLNGTIHENGVEYLVKKPALFGINVINRMPENKISFKEMISRLERVGQSENPVVKK
jgi:hypothetical protein